MMDEMIMTLLIIVGMVLLSIVIFSVLVQICKFVLIKLKSSEALKNSRLFNPLEYFPEEEISTIRQVFYLIIIVLIVVDILYSVVGWHENLIIFSVFDILLSLLFAVNVKWGSLKNKILLFGLISQDGMIDVNYDNGSLVVGVGKYEECISAIITYYDHSCQKGTKLAEYSSKAKALKVMEMLRDEYLQYCTARSNEYWFAFNNPKAFQFPKDEEVEV